MIGQSAILAPIVALAAWTMVMWLWMYATRIPAMRRAKIDVARLTGGVGKDLDKVLPPGVQWKAHNYNHLLEQPVLFYAITLVLAMVGAGGGFNLALAWAYVGLRIAHSIVQATINRVAVRFTLFALASLCLAALTLHAAIIVF
ncbi:MAG: MAPEG family protein [Sphingomonadales bacterium]|nr:MAPEG family protein [Sphingomonadales bacterium]